MSAPFQIGGTPQLSAAEQSAIVASPLGAAGATWAPLGPVAAAFYRDNAPRVVAVGPIGCGKSTVAVLRTIRHIFEQDPGADGWVRVRVLVIRQTYRQLVDNTIPTWRSILTDEWGTWEQTRNRFVINGEVNGKRIWAEILFRPLDDPTDITNLLGLELTFAVVEELREINPEVYAAIGGRVGRFPSPTSGASAKYAGIIAVTNPWSTDSKYHDLWVLNPRPGYVLHHFPSGLSPEAENLGSLRQTAATLKLPFDHPERQRAGRSYYLDAMRDLDPQDAAVLVESKFGVSRPGQACYQDYNDSVHCVPFDTQKGAGLIIGIDVGIRASAAVLLHRTPSGGILVIDEIVCFDTDIAGFVDRIKATLARHPECHVERFVVDPAASHRDLTGKSGIELLRACGVHALPAPTNAISARLACVGRLLRSLGRDGTPLFKLHPRCTWLRKGFISGYVFARSRAGQYADKPADSDFTHPHDALAYSCLAATGTLAGAMGTSGFRPPPPWPDDGRVIEPREVWRP